MIGNSFEDLVAGRIAANPVEHSALEAAPVTSGATVANPVTEAAARAEAVPVPPLTEAAPVSQRAPELSAPVQVTPGSATQAATASQTPRAAIPPMTPAAQPEPAERAAVTPDRITARPAPVAQTPSDDTPRPQQRIARPDPTPTPPRPPATQGNAEATARAGQSGGASQGQSSQTQQGSTGQSASDGAAAARYPQQVNRHLSRLRRPNARFDGATLVAFTISGNGGLANLSVARSSGSPEFDQMALAHIQRAVPFPAPPPGAQRSYSVTVRGR
jgi:protein TonB